MLGIPKKIEIKVYVDREGYHTIKYMYVRDLSKKAQEYVREKQEIIFGEPDNSPVLSIETIIAIEMKKKFKLRYKEIKC